MTRRVLRFALRRTAVAALTLLAVILVTFVCYWSIPNEPAAFVYPGINRLSPAQVQNAHHLLGVDRSKPTQFASYVWRLARGDFGGEWTGLVVLDGTKVEETPLRPQLFQATAITASIVGGGALLVVLLAVPLGLLAGRFLGSRSNRALNGLLLLAICIHPMVTSLVVRTIFGDDLHWFPVGGYCSFWPHELGPASDTQYQVSCNGPILWAQHLFLAWLSFAVFFVALYARMTRASVVETMHRQFVRTARAKGASEASIIRRHVLPNVALRVATLVGIEVATALGISVYIESAFGMPGLGRMAVRAMISTNALDLPRLLAVVTMLTLVVIAGNLLVDLVYAALDPRADRAARTDRAQRLGGIVL